MQFVKSGSIYKVSRITGVQDNLLGISLADHQAEIEVVALRGPDAGKIRTTPDEVLKQVGDGVSEFNVERGTHYAVSQIFYVPQESATNLVYKLLLVELLNRIDGEEEFKEVL